MVSFPMADSEWSQQEIDASVEAYLVMLIKELKRENYNKAATNRELREGPLSERSKGSLEMRMCNISAVLSSQKRPYIDGYKPRSNVGTQVTAMIADALARLQKVHPNLHVSPLQKGAQVKERDVILDIAHAEQKGDFDGVEDTERETLQKSRIGQGKFRQSLIDLWGCSSGG